ncbi:MAG: DUF167 domain-containing protein [Phycisphaerae bacterium]
MIVPEPWENPGLLEVILALEVITLLTALLFGTIARFIVRRNPTDTLARFWLQFNRVLAGRVHIAGVGTGTGTAGHTDEYTTAFDVDAPPTHDAPDLDALAGLGTLDGVGGGPGGGGAAEPTVTAGGAAVTKRPPGYQPRSAAEVAAPQTAVIDVLLVPLAEANRLTPAGGGFRAAVTYAGDDTRANAEVLKLITQALRVQPHQVTLLRGHNRTQKSLQIAGLTQDDVNRRLNAAVS